jgi:hypothetical protein
MGEMEDVNRERQVRIAIRDLDRAYGHLDSAPANVYTSPEALHAFHWTEDICLDEVVAFGFNALYFTRLPVRGEVEEAHRHGLVVIADVDDCFGFSPVLSVSAPEDPLLYALEVVYRYFMHLGGDVLRTANVFDPDEMHLLRQTATRVSAPCQLGLVLGRDAIETETVNEFATAIQTGSAIGLCTRLKMMMSPGATVLSWYSGQLHTQGAHQAHFAFSVAASGLGTVSDSMSLRDVARLGNEYQFGPSAAEFIPALLEAATQKWRWMPITDVNCTPSIIAFKRGNGDGAMVCVVNCSASTNFIRLTFLAEREDREYRITFSNTVALVGNCTVRLNGHCFAILENNCVFMEE